MKCFVTGAAGFIGSTLCDELLRQGHACVCIDAFTDYYGREYKEANVASFVSSGRCSFHEADITDCALEPLLEDVDIVFHLAATPGVRASWGEGFEAYVRNNVRATERLLFALKDREIRRFVYASSSSIYGDSRDLPLSETSLPQPYSPYGVTKLAGEHLARAYWRNYGVPAVSLRFFTVYGPRQRPDMAFHKFIRAALLGEPVPLYGDGRQTRDFTFVDDTVRAIIAVGTRQGIEGEILNVGGGSPVTVTQTLEILQNCLGREVAVERRPVQKGDVRDTQADTRRIREVLGFVPKTPIEVGLAAEVNWLRGMLRRP